MRNMIPIYRLMPDALSGRPNQIMRFVEEHMKRIRKTASLVAGTSLLALASYQSHAEEAVKVGLLLPYSGVYAQLAKDIDDAWQLALKERGGKVGDYTVELITEDTEASPQVAGQKANKVVKSDGAAVIAGVVSSGAGIALAGFAEKEKVPFVAAFSIADPLTGKFCNPYVARTSFSANALQSASGAYWAKAGVKTAVTLGPDYAAGHAMMEGFKRGFEAAGGEVVLVEYTPFGKTKDWGPSLLKAQQTGADIIYSFYAGSDAVQVVKQHAGFGMKEAMPLRGAMWLYDEALWDAMGGDQLDAIHVTVYTNALDTEASERFEKAFAEMHGHAPVASNALGYDNAVATLDGLAAAIEANGGKLPEDKAKIIDALTGLTIDSPRGPLTFNSSHNAKVDNLYMVQVVDEGDGPKQKLLEPIPYGEDLPGCDMQ